MSRASRWLALAAAAVLSCGVALAASVRPELRWTRLTATNVSELGEPALTLVGGRALLAWPVRPGTTTTTIALESFLPSVARDVVSPRPVTKPVVNWQAVGNTPVFLATAGGGHSLLFNGIRSFRAGDFDGELLAPLVSAGSLGNPAVVGRDYSGNLTGLMLLDGTPITASDGAGAVVVLRGLNGQAGIDLQKRDAGSCCGYQPALGRDGQGRVWLAWFSNAQSQSGIYLQQIDPASGGPLGGAIKAPASNNAWNLDHRVQLVCASRCRLVYWTLRVPARGKPIPSVVSWWPGETQPTRIASVIPTTVTIPSLTAAYRRDGHLWVAWYDGRGYPSQPPGVGYYATLGNARGAGGQAFFVGQAPIAQLGSYALASAAVGNNLLLAAIDGVAGRQGAIWINVVPPPPPCPHRVKGKCSR
jgi:hypothetical protein